MKKLLCLLFASMVVLSMAMPAFAKGHGGDGSDTSKATRKTKKTKNTKTRKTTSGANASSFKSN